MKTILKTKNGNIEITEPEINKMYEELTRLIVLSEYWENKQFKTLMKICLKARQRKKLIYGHEIKTFNPKLNMFYTNKNEDNFSIFITGISVLIDDKEMDIADAYIKLITSNIISYKRNNIFKVKRKGFLFSPKPYRYYKGGKLL